MAIDHVVMCCPRCRKGTPVPISGLTAHVIYCQHCRHAPVLTHPTIVAMRNEAAKKRYRPMLEQTLRTAFPELGDKPLTDEQVGVYSKKLRQLNERKRRCDRRPEPPFEVCEEWA
jgi:hypothetical protein